MSKRYIKPSSRKGSETETSTFNTIRDANVDIRARKNSGAVDGSQDYHIALEGGDKLIVSHKERKKGLIGFQKLLGDAYKYPGLPVTTITPTEGPMAGKTFAVMEVTDFADLLSGKHKACLLDKKAKRKKRSKPPPVGV